MNLFIAIAVVALGFFVLSLGFKIAQFGLKYLLLFAFIGGFGYSAYKNSPPTKPTIEQATEGKEVHRCDIQRITEFSPTQISIIYNHQEYVVKGQCTVWQPNLVGVAQDNKYIFFLMEETFMEDQNVHQAPHPK